MLRLCARWLEKAPPPRRPVMFKARPTRHAPGEGAAPVMGAGAGAARVITVAEGEPIYTGAEMDVGYDEEGAEHEDARHRLIENVASTSSGAAAVAAPPPPAEAAATPKEGSKSASAYHFLLNHIDAEIEALQRRHKEVTSRRKNEEEKQNTRIKELFKYMENPWLLLETPVEPALPCTGVDVYIKEVTLEHRKSGKADDKMFVLACHKNYHNMPFAEKKHYEGAARYNANLRQQMKQQLSSGLTRFETFCSQMKEGTAEMSKQGKLPEIANLSLTARPWMRQRSQKKGAHSAEAAATKEEHDDPAAEEEEDEDEGEGQEETAEDAKPSRGRGAKRKPAAKKAKNAIKQKAHPKLSKASGRKPQAKKTKKAAPKATKARAAPGSRKKAAAAASTRAAPKSIPLPRIDLSALKKKKNGLKKSRTPKKKVAGKASKKKLRK